MLHEIFRVLSSFLYCYISCYCISPLFLLNYCTVCDRKFDFLSSSFSSKICCLAAESFTFSGASREKRDQKPRLTSRSGFTEKQLCSVLHESDVLVKCFFGFDDRFAAGIIQMKHLRVYW